MRGRVLCRYCIGCMQIEKKESLFAVTETVFCAVLATLVIFKAEQLAVLPLDIRIPGVAAFICLTDLFFG